MTAAELVQLYGADPTTAAVDCEVWVDGARLADTAEAFLSLAPTALSGLSLTWGRATVVDSPDTSTCQLTVADRDSDGDYLDLLHVGSQLDVYAAGLASSGTDPLDITTDGGFEYTKLTDRARITAGGGALAYTTDTPAEGLRALRVLASGANPQVSIPPAPFSTKPSAWDLIPSVTAGDTWTVELKYRLGAPGRTQTWGGVAIFTTPTGPGQSWTTSEQFADGSGWLQYRTTVTIPADAPYGWLGARLAPVFARWSSPVTVGTWAAQPNAWEAWGRVDVDDLHVWAPPQPLLRVLTFTGRITNLAAGIEGGKVSVDVTAADWTADLANDEIGDIPWPAQTIKVRAARIAALSSRPFTLDIDAFPAARMVTYTDVDAQPVMGLLDDMATSADSLLWSAFHATRGFYLWMEDTALRQSLAVLSQDGGTGIVSITGNPHPTQGVVLSACDLPEDPVRFTQDVTDVITRVDAVWMEQTLDGQGVPAPTERHIVLDDAAAQDQWGVRRMSYTTQLTSAADGQTVAQRVLNRSRALGWKASGVEWDTRLPAQYTDALRGGLLHLLDGTRRIGCALAIQDMPQWSPSGDLLTAYVEGGTYTYADGRWQLSLNVSPMGTTGQSIKWNQVTPSYQWKQFSTDIHWWNMFGVGTG